MNKLLKFSDEAKQQNQNKRKKILWQKFVKSDKFWKMGHFLCRKVVEETEIQKEMPSEQFVIKMSCVWFNLKQTKEKFVEHSLQIWQVS